MKLFRLFFSITIFFVLAPMAWAAVPGPAGCLQTQHYLGILKLYGLDFPSEAASLIREMNYIKVQACSGAFSESSSIYYKNGRLATNYAGREDASWYWPDGRLLTNYALRADSSMYYPNGRLMTNYFLRSDSSYYYADGSLLSNYIGRPNSSLYIKGGGTVNSPGFLTADGNLDFVAMTDYVEAMSAGESGGGTINCDNSTLKSKIQEAINSIKANQSNNAISVLNQVKGCL